MANITLTIVAFEYPPYVSLRRDDSGTITNMWGLMASSISNISAARGWTLRYVQGYLSPRHENGTYLGYHGFLKRDEADIAVGIDLLSPPLFDDFQCLFPEYNFPGVYIYGGSIVPYVKKPTFNVLAFSSDVWLCTIVSVILMTLMLASLHSASDGNWSRYVQRIWSHFFRVLSSLVTTSSHLYFSPKNQSARPLIALWLLATLVLVEYFHGDTRSKTAVRTQARRVESVQDLVTNFPTLKIQLVKGHPQMENVWKLSENRYLRAFYQQVKRFNGEQDPLHLFTESTIGDAKNRKAVFLSDSISVYNALAWACPALGGYYYESSEPAEYALMVNLARKNLNKTILDQLDWGLKRLLETGHKPLRYFERFPLGSMACRWDLLKDVETFQSMTCSEMSFVFYGYLAGTIGLPSIGLCFEYVRFGISKLKSRLNSPN